MWLHGPAAAVGAPGAARPAVGFVLAALLLLLPGDSNGGGGRDHHRRGGRPSASIPQQCKNADESELNSFLWTIKRDPPSYFFGTIHVPYTRVWDYIPENTREAFDRAENVFFELDLTDPYTISQLANCQLLPHGGLLSDILPKDLYRRLKRHLEYVKLMMPTWMTADQKGSGLYADYLFNAITGNWERKRPVWVMLMVNSLTEADIKSRGIPVLDLYLAQEAERLSKTTGAVERVDEQCVPLNELNFSQVVFALNQTLWQHEAYRQGSGTHSYSTDELIRHYNCGDLNMVIFSHDTAQVPNLVNQSLRPGELKFAKRIDEYFREKLIYKRNKRMANEVANLLHSHPNRSFFFAFGAGHFLGNHTVIDNMVEQGFQVDHAAAHESIFLGKNFVKKKRKKLPPPHYQVPPLAMGSYIDYLDPFFDHRRHRHRQRNHQRGRRKGRRRDRVHATTDSYHLKQPQFNDLWVRLDATSFGPEAFFRQQPRPTQAPASIQSHNSGSRGSFSHHYSYQLYLPLICSGLFFTALNSMSNILDLLQCRFLTCR